MTFWYGVIRNVASKIRFLRVSTMICPSQASFLTAMTYAPDAGDTVVELDCGNYMSGSEFTSYVHEFFMNL
jgi:hypothetical protein